MKEILTKEELEFAEYLASRLWEMSSLRHALFTPDQFQRICASTIKQAMHDRKTKHEDQAVSEKVTK